MLGVPTELTQRLSDDVVMNCGMSAQLDRIGTDLPLAVESGRSALLADRCLLMATM